jgi:hypothetical protein
MEPIITSNPHVMHGEPVFRWNAGSCSDVLRPSGGRIQGDRLPRAVPDRPAQSRSSDCWPELRAASAQGCGAGMKVLVDEQPAAPNPASSYRAMTLFTVAYMGWAGVWRTANCSGERRRPGSTRWSRTTAGWRYEQNLPALPLAVVVVLVPDAVEAAAASVAGRCSPRGSRVYSPARWSKCPPLDRCRRGRPPPQELPQLNSPPP